MGRQGGNIIVLSSFFEKYIYFMLGVQFPILSVLNRQYQFLTDISLAKDKTDKVAKDTKVKFTNGNQGHNNNNNNGVANNNWRMDVNQHTNLSKEPEYRVQ